MRAWARASTASEAVGGVGMAQAGDHMGRLALGIDKASFPEQVLP